MRLRALRLANVRRFADEGGGSGVALEGIADGLNVFAEPNETGKSTLFDALYALLFFKHGSRHSDIRALEPYGGGAPRIEADIALAGGRFRIAKRFLSRPMAQVLDLDSGREVARAEAAQDWIDGALGLRGAESGPAGLLWVRQGAALGLDPGVEAREGALAGVVEAELAALTGGARMARMQGRVADALARNLTSTDRPRKGGPLQLATDAAATQEAELERLGAALRELRSDLDRRAELRRRIAREADPEEIEAERAALAAAQERLERARAEAGRISELTTALELRRVERNGVAETRQRFAKAIETVAACRAALEQAEAAVPAAEAGVEAAEGRARSDSAAADAAEAAVREAEAAERAGRQAREAIRLQAEAARLAKALAEAEAAERAASAALGRAEAIAATPAGLEAAERAAADLAAAEAGLAASRTTVSVAYEGPDAPRIRHAGGPLGEGERLTLAETAAFALPGIGTLTLQPGSGDAEAKAAHDRARNALSKALAPLGVADLDAARAALRNREAAETEAKRAEAIRNAVAPDGLPALRRAHALAAARLAEAGPIGEDDASPDLEALGVAVEAARNAAEGARHARERAALASQAATAALERSRRDRAEADRRLQDALSETGPEAGWDARRSALDDALKDAASAHDAAALQLRLLREDAIDPALAGAEVKRLSEAAENRRLRLADLRMEEAACGGRLERATEDAVEERHARAQDALGPARAALARIEAEIAALKRLGQALEEASAGMKERYFAPLERALSPLLRLVFDGGRLAFDSERLLPETLERDGLSEPFGVLSGGTQEQVAILTRLAFAALLAEGGEAPPVILDDALVFSDDDRIERMFTALQTQTERLQIIA
ncbi:MAG: chromosome segregation protein SMC, partial [Pseudomonadota bacterium]